METTATLTATQAHRWAYLLADWGYTAIQIVESVPAGERFIKAENRVGQKRIVRGLADFNELKALEGAR